MQTSATQLVDTSDAPEHIRELYGLNDDTTRGFGRQCLLARRFVESGVRHSLLVHGVQIGRDSWDDHGNVEAGMRKHCREVDQPVAGLLTDLKQRGLLDETLVVWASKMGRTPFINGKLRKTPGREHSSYALTMWIAGGDVKGGDVKGGDVKGGETVGETDEFSLRSIGESVPIRDVHATILNLMGLDDEELRFLQAGRMRQLTDIGGSVLSDLIA